VILSRRHLLSAWTVLGAGLAARPASALTLDTLSPSATALYLDGCRAREQDFHKQLMAEVEATLKEKQVSEADRERILAETTCPLCGCPLFAS
jgi:hypothetical protein